MPPPSSPRIGFLGYGEVAAALAEALASHGVEVFAYDLLWDRPEGRAVLQGRDRSGRVRFGSLADTIGAIDLVLSTVTSSVAVVVARNAARYLNADKTYLDLNATSPALKREVAAAVSASGADFVEGAILGAIGVTGAKTKILLGGERAEAIAGQLAAWGLHTVFYSREIGRASAFKLLRSVFSKGMEALLIEYLVAGRRAGIQHELWREVVDLFSANSFEQVASNWIATHGTAHERRYHEVQRVSDELRALGVEPVMTGATEHVFQRSCDFDLRESFSDGRPTPEDVIGAIAHRLGGGTTPPPR